MSEPSTCPHCGQDTTTLEGAAKGTLFVNSIIGSGFKTQEFAVQMTERGLARFIGNQHNEAWAWIREEVEKLSAEDVRTLYDLVYAQHYAQNPGRPEFRGGYR
jgi:hypothetical protein